MHINDELKKIANKLKNKKIKISVAESCTGGLISLNLIKTPGASKYFNMGIISYSNYSKKKILKVKDKTLKNYGAVSAEICKEMCENLLKISKSNITISTTGIAGPNGGSKKKPIGLVYIGVAGKNGTKIVKFNFNKKFTRENIQKKTLIETIKIIKKNINLL
jgi:PncC family amidohydrolase